MSEPDANASSTAAEEAPSAVAKSELGEQLLGFADEAGALIAALGRLASAEASLSLTALLRTLSLRLLGAGLLGLAIAFLAVSGAIVLADWLGSTAAALAAIAALVAAVAAIALWRAAVWRGRIGLRETRAAMTRATPDSAEPQP